MKKVIKIVLIIALLIGSVSLKTQELKFGHVNSR